MLSRLRKEGGKVSFEEMGKIIGQRWKNIDPDRLGRFSELAAEDTERYKKEMQAYNSRQEAKMRSEALKPAAAFPGGRGDMGKDMGRGGYADPMASAFGNPAMSGGYSPYGGMEFGGYPGMGMQGMYGPYGGYQGMGAGGSEMPPQMNQGGMGDGGQYGRNAAMYGMMGGFQGGMMGYGGGGGGQGGDYGQQMDPSQFGSGYGQGWGQP